MLTKHECIRIDRITLSVFVCLENADADIAISSLVITAVLQCAILHP